MTTRHWVNALIAAGCSVLVVMAIIIPGDVGLDVWKKLFRVGILMVILQGVVNFFWAMVDASPNGILRNRFKRAGCWQARFLYIAGIPPTHSRGICGMITCGYGSLSDNGYWQYELDVDNETHRENIQKAKMYGG